MCVCPLGCMHVCVCACAHAGLRGVASRLSSGRVGQSPSDGSCGLAGSCAGGAAGQRAGLRAATAGPLWCAKRVASGARSAWHLVPLMRTALSAQGSCPGLAALIVSSIALLQRIPGILGNHRNPTLPDTWDPHPFRGTWDPHPFRGTWDPHPFRGTWDPHPFRGTWDQIEAKEGCTPAAQVLLEGTSEG